MARTYTPKVNKHVTYFDTNGKPRPGTIIAVTSATVVDVRIGHSGETHLGISRAPIDSLAANVVNTWRPA